MTLPRSPTLFRLKSWAIMVNDRLFPAISRVRPYRRLPHRDCAFSCPEPTAELLSLAADLHKNPASGGAPRLGSLARTRHRCEPIHIPDRLSCASLLMQGRPDSSESRWRLIDQAMQFFICLVSGMNAGRVLARGFGNICKRLKEGICLLHLLTQ